MTTLPAFLVDLRSDTVTRPTALMRAAMAHAEVGDDVVDGDPTTKRLERTVAGLLGKESALFFPSGAMANLAALLVHTTPGTEVLVDANAHVVHWDMAGSAAIAGVAMHLVKPGALVMSAADVEQQMRPHDSYGIRASLLFLENTHNGAGGVVSSVSDMRALHNVARNAGLPIHLDGARLWNAAVATGVPLSAFCELADTVMVSFSKGIGAPVGAALAGSTEHIRRADGIRKRLGGGMRQSGIIAAGALYGVQNHVERLRDDHDAARAFASIVEGAAGARVVPPDTNIVMIDLPSPVAEQVVTEAERAGVRVSAWTPSRIRAVTHLDAPVAAVQEGATRLAAIIDGAAAR